MKVVLLMICQERMDTLMASDVMALMTGGGTNPIGALIGKAIIVIGLISGLQRGVHLGCSRFYYQTFQKKTLMLYNATFHKGKAMQKMLEDAGHSLLYFPPYSLDLNPIEKKWT
ncbi:transposase [Holospora undulata]|uniref:Tc1-like transposase DDE domain-containing protein n=1 Tax=Holospora undulata HU1 TaxID=1321371 RepID=A0A061JFW0_9PROT|nr:transposase [Holospora undulata]ETZ04641.1 hypothetical protein K737_300935 [Holospora undulata HU1]